MQVHRGYPAESSFLSYGLVVHLLLLPTPPLGDAVAFGYRPESICLKRTYTSLTSRALRRTHHRLYAAWFFNFHLTVHPLPTSRHHRLYAAWFFNFSLSRNQRSLR